MFALAAIPMSNFCCILLSAARDAQFTWATSHLTNMPLHNLSKSLRPCVRSCRRAREVRGVSEKKGFRLLQNNWKNSKSSALFWFPLPGTAEATHSQAIRIYRAPYVWNSLLHSRRASCSCACLGAAIDMRSESACVHSWGCEENCLSWTRQRENEVAHSWSFAVRRNYCLW